MGDILVSATSEVEYTEFVHRLWSIVNYTGGWVGWFGEGDCIGELEIRLISFRASDEELELLWERVRAGEDAASAWETVRGPSYQYRKMREALLRRLESSASLEGADLAGQDLSLFQLSLKNMRCAILRATDLTQAGLAKADLSGADLRDADLSEAILAGTDLMGADLTGAKLSGAQYDSQTRWPDGFDPQQHGAVVRRETRRPGKKAARGTKTSALRP